MEASSPLSRSPPSSRSASSGFPSRLSSRDGEKTWSSQGQWRVSFLFIFKPFPHDASGHGENLVWVEDRERYQGLPKTRCLCSFLLIRDLGLLRKCDQKGSCIYKLPSFDSPALADFGLTTGLAVHGSWAVMRGSRALNHGRQFSLAGGKTDGSLTAASRPSIWDRLHSLLVPHLVRRCHGRHPSAAGLT